MQNIKDMNIKTLLIDGMAKAAEEQYQMVVFLDQMIENKINCNGYNYKKSLDYNMTRFRLLRCILAYVIIDKMLGLCQ